MELTSLTYTSLARPDLQSAELEEIRHTACHLNALHGVTGLLVFNGTHFLQIVEGAHGAIAKLLERLRCDPRHTGLEIRDERKISTRCFPESSMDLVRVSQSYFEARDTITERLPETVPEVIKLRLLRMTELISTMEFD